MLAYLLSAVGGFLVASGLKRSSTQSFAGGGGVSDDVSEILKTGLYEGVPIKQKDLVRITFNRDVKLEGYKLLNAHEMDIYDDFSNTGYINDILSEINKFKKADVAKVLSDPSHFNFQKGINYDFELEDYSKNHLLLVLTDSNEYYYLLVPKSIINEIHFRSEKNDSAEFTTGYYNADNEFIRTNRPAGDGKKFAGGGFVTDIDKAFGTPELKQRARRKMKKGDAVVAFAYTDYGGNFFDKVAIEFFQKNYPRNTVVEEAIYNGKNAIVFGKPAKEFLEESEKYLLGFDDIENYYYERVSQEEYEEFDNFLKNIQKYDDYTVKEGALEWLMENKSGHYSMTPQGLDYSDSDLIDILEEEDLIEKNEENTGIKFRFHAD